MDLGLAGRVAVVAASSKGLGRGTATALAAEGVSVLLSARGQAALDEAVAAITDAGGTAEGVVADITDPDVPAQLVARAVERWGRLDIVVGNAGGPPHGGALDVDDEALLAAVNANMLASIRLARAAIPHLRGGGWGRICFITSVTVRQPAPMLALSNVARTGLWAWAKTAASDLAGDGITVNLACPGAHLTERLVGLGAQAGSIRAGDPDDFGKVVAFLCSGPAGFMSGTAVGVDGGAVAGLL